VSVAINSPSYNSEFAVDDTNLGPDSLQFNTDEVKRFVIEFVPDSNDVNNEIQVSGVSRWGCSHNGHLQIGAINLVMGNTEQSSLDLKFNPLSSQSSTPPDLLHFKYCPQQLDFDNILPLPSTLLIPRHSKLEIGLEYAIPALLGEWFEIKIFINNEESHSVKDMKVEVNLGKDETISLSMNVSQDCSVV
jgi:hypothetical protein